MPQLRKDIISGKWSVVAVNRSMRPESFTHAHLSKSARLISDCPFCRGHESQTPPELDAVRLDASRPNTPGWDIRVVPNKYPAFTMDEVDEDDDNLYQHQSALGLHEVIIHSPHHHLSLSTMQIDEVVKVIKMYKRRYLLALKNPQVKSAVIIVNHGRQAGASIEHSHAQLFAIPMIPNLLKRESDSFSAHYLKNGDCIFCDLIQHEISVNRRIVAENSHFIAFCPYASQTPFTTWIAPKSHLKAFEVADEEVLNSCASILQRVLISINKNLHDPPYNIWLHSRPKGKDEFHWHLEIAPKLAIPAGFELGTGMTINVVQPEEAAKYLKLF